MSDCRADSSSNNNNYKRPRGATSTTPKTTVTSSVVSAHGGGDTTEQGRHAKTKRKTTATGATSTPTKTPPPSTRSSSNNGVDEEDLPTAYRFGGGAKESHGHPIYCVAWSPDVYEEEETATATATATAAAVVATPRSNDDDDDDDDDDSVYQGETEDGGENDDGDDEHEGTDDDDRKVRGGRRRRRGRIRRFECFATCAGPFATVYEVESTSEKHDGGKTVATTGAPRVRQIYRDVDDGENFYACVFAGRGPSLVVDGDDDDDDVVGDPSTWRGGASLLCCAGGRGVVRLIDPLRRRLVATLSGHGDDVYDLRVSPADDRSLVTASKDGALRLWDLRTLRCVAVFSGHEAHRDAALTADFHPSGDRLVSGGMDTSVRIWSLRRGAVVETPDDDDDEPRTRVEQLPLFSTSRVHADYVDCVRFAGDLVLSKSITNTVVLWKPDPAHFRRPPAEDDVTVRPPPRDGGVVFLREFRTSNCTVWFVRFGVDHDRRLLALGNTSGRVRVWRVDGDDDLGGETTTTTTLDPSSIRCATELGHKDCSGKTIRTVAFSPDGRTLVATCDDSTVWKWDGVSGGAVDGGRERRSCA